MDKGRRQELARLKMVKRIKNIPYIEEDMKNIYILKNTGTPCSCHLCSGEKFSRKRKHKLLIFKNE